MVLEPAGVASEFGCRDGGYATTEGVARDGEAVTSVLWLFDGLFDVQDGLVFDILPQFQKAAVDMAVLIAPWVLVDGITEDLEVLDPIVPGLGAAE